MHSKITALSLFLIAALDSTQVLAFPEIPFCPLGGPPGWANRLFNDYDYYDVPPPYYGKPYHQQYPAYTPTYPREYPNYWYPSPLYQGY